MKSSAVAALRGPAVFILAVASVLLLALLPAVASEPTTAYLWSVRRGCQVDPVLEDAALSRIREVGRQVVLLNIPASAEARSCIGKDCAEIVRRSGLCVQIKGPVLGAELDEVRTAGGLLTRIRAWRYDLSEGAGSSLMQEFVTCPAGECGHREVQEAVAKALNRLLDREPGTGAESVQRASVAFPSKECAQPLDVTAGGSLPAYCEQPMGASCRAEELIPPEPSGRSGTALSVTVREPPTARPRRWEWLPIAGTLVGALASVGIGIANEFVTTSYDVGHVLTPALWTGVGLTVALGASSLAVIGDRYQREKHSYEAVHSSSACALLADGGPGEAKR